MVIYGDPIFRMARPDGLPAHGVQVSSKPGRAALKGQIGPPQHVPGHAPPRADPLWTLNHSVTYASSLTPTARPPRAQGSFLAPPVAGSSGSGLGLEGQTHGEGEMLLISASIQYKTYNITNITLSTSKW